MIFPHFILLTVHFISEKSYLLLCSWFSNFISNLVFFLGFNNLIVIEHLFWIVTFMQSSIDHFPFILTFTFSYLIESSHQLSHYLAKIQALTFLYLTVCISLATGFYILYLLIYPFHSWYYYHNCMYIILCPNSCNSLLTVVPPYFIISPPYCIQSDFSWS